VAAAFRVEGYRRLLNGGEAAVHYATLGYPTAAIKEILGHSVSEETIGHAITRARNAGVQIKKFTSVKSKIGALWVAGMSAREIANDLDLPIDAVEIIQKRILREAGVK
jgi:DNA-binding CsgD family transcriptional regulator